MLKRDHRLLLLEIELKLELPISPKPRERDRLPICYSSYIGILFIIIFTWEPRGPTVS